jgi:predicted nucleic acid-binding protein
VTLVDSTIILDIATNDPRWANWSQFQLERATLAGPLVINDIIYADVSVRYELIEDLDAALDTLETRLEAMPREALFLAAKVYRQHRARGGTRTGVLSDFFIGAHAAVADYTLLTRDPVRYRSYFPTIRMIFPD